ncbi:uncharacterized protein [Watersipora subatra]|uniref:uncharacterized protein n=1 Tax=Watersipora subatra TaxID=2589382 RepID=UPI00355C91DA
MVKVMKPVANIEPMWAAMTRSTPKKSLNNHGRLQTATKKVPEVSNKKYDRRVKGNKDKPSNVKTETYKVVISSLVGGVLDMYNHVTENGSGVELDKIKREVVKALKAAPESAAMLTALVSSETKSTSVRKINYMPADNQSTCNVSNSESCTEELPSIKDARKEDGILCDTNNCLSIYKQTLQASGDASKSLWENYSRRTYNTLSDAMAATKEFHIVRAKALKILGKNYPTFERKGGCNEIIPHEYVHQSTKDRANISFRSCIPNKPCLKSLSCANLASHENVQTHQPCAAGHGHRVMLGGRKLGKKDNSANYTVSLAAILL